MESCLENRDNCIESLKRSLTDQCHLENLKYKEKYVITQVHMECWSGENAVYLNLQLRAGVGAARHDAGVLARHGRNVNKCRLIEFAIGKVHFWMSTHELLEHVLFLLFI